MSDEKTEHQLIISLSNKGNVQIGGTLIPTGTAYMMLELAKEIILINRVLAYLKEQDRIVTAPAGWKPPGGPPKRPVS